MGGGGRGWVSGWVSEWVWVWVCGSVGGACEDGTLCTSTLRTRTISAPELTLAWAHKNQLLTGYHL